MEIHHGFPRQEEVVFFQEVNLMERETVLATAETVKDAATAASVLDHIKNNRIKYLLALALLHLMGISDKILGQVSGYCF